MLVDGRKRIPIGFRFRAPVCQGGSRGGNASSFFFGNVSRLHPLDALAMVIRNLDIPVPSRVLSGYASGLPAASVGICVPILSPPGGS